MTISNWIKKTHFLFLVFIFIPNIFANAPTTAQQEFDKLDPAMQQQVQAQMQKIQDEYLEQQLKPLLKFLEELDFICEHLAQVINNRQLRNIDNQKALNHIKGLRTTIGDIKKGPYVVLDVYSIKLLTAVIEHITAHLRVIVKNGLTNLPQLDLLPLIKRNIDSNEIDFEKLEQQLTANQKAIQALDKESQYIGLSLFNRSYRHAEKFCADHHLFSRTGKVLIGGIFSAFIVSCIDKDAMEKLGLNHLPGLSNLKNKIGSKPIPIDQEFTNKKDLGLFGTIESVLGRNGLGVVDFAVPAFISWQTFFGPLKPGEFSKNPNIQKLQLWFSKKWEPLRSRLRGGPAERKVEAWKNEPKVRFANIIGKEHHKQVLSRVIDYIRDHERYDRAGIAPEAGYLLAGPSRSGKSYIAEAIAGEIKDALAKKGISDEFNFFSFTAADVKMWGINTILQLAKDSAPCVLFIDEIDMCGWQRERDAQALSQVLTAMSGCMNNDKSKTVIIIGATNKPQNLDKALLQKGRFGKILWFDYPTLEDRYIYLVRELENRSIMTIDQSYIKKLALETDRCTFADLESIISTALQKSKAEGRVLNESHLESAFDEEVRHILFEDPVLPAEHKRLIAVHQAGHTLATLLLDKESEITKVTIRPINIEIKEENLYAKYNYYDGKANKEEYKKEVPIEFGSLFSAKPMHAETLKTYDEHIHQCKIKLAGNIAEKIVLGSSGFTYHKDDKRDALAITKYVTFEGMDYIRLPKKEEQALEQKSYNLMLACEREMQQLLTQYKPQLLALADALEKRLTLTYDEIKEIIDGTAPKETAAPVATAAAAA